MRIVGLDRVRQPNTSVLDRAVLAQLLSDRHRQWGYDCPAVDLDFVTYNRGEPLALIEYKHEMAAQMDLQSMKQQRYRPFAVLSKFATKAGIPFFICRYSGDLVWYKAEAINPCAKPILPHRKQFDERAWV